MFAPPPPSVLDSFNVSAGLKSVATEKSTLPSPSKRTCLNRFLKYGVGNRRRRYKVGDCHGPRQTQVNICPLSGVTPFTKHLSTTALVPFADISIGTFGWKCCVTNWLEPNEWRHHDCNAESKSKVVSLDPIVPSVLTDR